MRNLFKGIPVFSVVIMVVLLIGGLIYSNRPAVAQLLQNTALYLRVFGIGTSSAPLNALSMDCDVGDQYYSCATYTTSNGAVKGTLRVNFNGVARYIRLYNDPS